MIVVAGWLAGAGWLTAAPWLAVARWLAAGGWCAAAGWLAALGLAVWVLRLRSVLGCRMELVARACHELRRPITVARLGLEILARENQIRSEPLQAVELELASAGLALEDLSGALTGRPGPWRTGHVEVTALLADSVAAFRPVALARGVELGLRSADAPAVICADRLRLAQATGNLIANAIEHGRGHVELCGRSDGRKLEIEVTDGGEGLPAPVADLVVGRRRGRGSRGRGLAIAADIARRHGGRLEGGGDARCSRLKLVLPTEEE